MSIQDIMKYFDLLDMCHQEKGAMLAILGQEKDKVRGYWNELNIFLSKTKNKWFLLWFSFI